MSTAAVLAVHRGPYSLADLRAMPEDGQRYELFDGGLHVTPAPTPRHQRAARRLTAVLNAAGESAGLEAIEGIDLDCGPDTVLQPDVVLLPAKLVDDGPRVNPAGQVALVAEVVSPSSVRLDRVFKAQIYADAGVPHYLVIELDEPMITWFARSASGLYARRAVVRDDEILTLTEPVSVELAPSHLLRAWG